MNRVEIKKKAKEFAFNNKWNLWKPFLVIFGLSFVFSFIMNLVINEKSSVYDLLRSLVILALLPMSIGSTSYILKLIRGTKVELKEALLSKYNIFGFLFMTVLIVGVHTFLWSLLFVIPGIIYSFKMVMVQYILAEDECESMTNKEVINRSENMMDGYKIDFFVFKLSFIGWLFLSSITFGIALIWVMPYIVTADAMYYEELKKVKNI